MAAWHDGPMPAPPSVDELRSIGVAHGLDALGVARAEVFDGTRVHLHERKARGLHASMQFTYRNPDRSTDPRRSLPTARSLVVGALGYLRDARGVSAVGAPAGVVARYVWEDHYAALRHALGAVASALSDGGYEARILVDDNALVDREAAHRAGLGWYGKNANLLLPGRGSWFVLGSVLTDAELPAAEPVADGCGSCDRCLSSCPTGAIIEPGVIDANRCLAWLVQADGVFPAEHRVALGDRIYGCDECQEVCPPNRRETRRPVSVGGAAQRRAVPLLELLEAADAALMADYGQWYIPRREPRYLRRNALVALGNVGRGDDQRTIAALGHWLGCDDALLRAHAVWAARRLGLDDLLGLVADDPDPTVRAELARNHLPPA